MNEIRISQIIRQESGATIVFACVGEISKYFNDKKTFTIEYFEDIQECPDSIIVIPFLTNILPIVWLTDATLYVAKLDEDFYKCIDKLKSGYKLMCPDFNYKGNIEVEELQKNFYEAIGSAALFSGGLDAVSTMFAHSKEEPKLITIWGADINIDDEKGWNIVKDNTNTTAMKFGFPSPGFVKSNFRTFFNVKKLDDLVSETGDFWWHAFQHGIGMLGLVAPLAFKYRIKHLYIASSYKEGDNELCASDPKIDNHLTFSGISIHHDQYNFSRQDKIKFVTNCCNHFGSHINLRVCWRATGGINCCDCEKCIRTIMGLLAENQDPALYGLSYTRKQMKNYKATVIRTLKDSQFLGVIWKEIQNRFYETRAFENNNDINWIYSLNVNQRHLKLYFLYRKLRAFGGKILRSSHLID